MGLRWDSAAQNGEEITGIPNTWNKQHVSGSVMGVREARGRDVFEVEVRLCKTSSTRLRTLEFVLRRQWILWNRKAASSHAGFRLTVVAMEESRWSSPSQPGHPFTCRERGPGLAFYPPLPLTFQVG